MTAAPRSLGYRLPAEWEAHARSWLAWPHDAETFEGRLGAVEETYMGIAEVLAADEGVGLLVRGPADRRRVARALEGRGVDPRGVAWVEAPYADVWIRDYGPMFVVRPGQGGVAAVLWRFNAWGGKYPTHMREAEAGAALAQALGVPCFRAPAVLEGGAVDADGRGTLLTTESCLLGGNRNPGLSREDVESLLHDYLGAERVVWLRGGISGDDTDGHVDDVARFVRPGVVAACVADHPSHPDHAVLRDNLRILEGAVDASGRRLEVVPLPMPETVEGRAGRLPASYANFYIANRSVLVPVFGVPSDERALEIMAGLFPGRRIVPVPCRDLVRGLGAVHCITSQEPLAGI